MKTETDALKLKDMISRVINICNPSITIEQAATTIAVEKVRTAEPKAGIIPNDEQIAKMSIISMDGVSPKGTKFINCAGMGQAARILYSMALSYSPEFFEDANEIYCSYTQISAQILGSDIVAESTRYWASRSMLVDCLARDSCRGDFVDFIPAGGSCLAVNSVKGGYIKKQGWLDVSKGPPISTTQCKK